MNPPPAGSRVLVTWNDGRVYPATLCAFAQGLAQVRWDGGAASAWVPIANVRSPGGGPPSGSPTPPTPPAPSGWSAYPAYSSVRATPTPGPTSGHAPTPSHAQVGGVVSTPGPGGVGGYAPPSTPGAASKGPASVPQAASREPVSVPQATSRGRATLPQVSSMTPAGVPQASSGAPASVPQASSGVPASGPGAPVLGSANVPRAAPVFGPPSGPPPRAMGGTVGGLPRGLIYEPTGAGPGRGQAFFIFFGFVTSADGDPARRSSDLEHLGDDVAALCAAGYRVVVDLHADLAGLNAALAGTHPDAAGAAAAGIFWGSHADEDGSIEDSEGFLFTPGQIAAEATRRGACKLFVMSAHGAERHHERWQKALGPQATIIAWGSPLAHDRASDFLIPDDASSKGFDDLLERHLAAPRVAADGPLVEARELARRDEDKPASRTLTFDDLLAAAHQRLACPLQRGKRGDAYFTVRTPPTNERPDAPRAQIVRAAPVGLADSFVLVSSLVGPHSDAFDLARGLRTISPALHLRLAIARISPPEQDFVVIETLGRRRHLDAVTLARSIRTVGVYADRLEDVFFGSDRR